MNKSEAFFTGVDSIKSFEGFLNDASTKYSGFYILTDSNTRTHCLPVLMSRFQIPEQAVIMEVEPGEKIKNIQTCIRLWQELAALGADRYSLLICLGGGVVCDMGGFVASTYQRGIDFIYLPTTLLAQVDAAIGGKTGVNLDRLKNYIGLFSPAKAIFAFTVFLKTLPFNELLSGYAEIIKHTLLSSEQSFRQLMARFPDHAAIRQSKEWGSVVERSVIIKENVVRSDPYEQGLRKVLNLGHTVGHALESYSLGKDDSPLLHGYAVAMGLIVELKLSVQLCDFQEKLAAEISDYILSIFPYYAVEPPELESITRLMGFDKKNRSGNINMTLIRKPGELLTDVSCSDTIIEKCLMEYLEMGKR